MENIPNRIKKAIDGFLEEQHQQEPPRTHLGASIIGKPCTRELWYSFRWAKKEKPSGQLLRLYNRGHLEELRFINYLRSVGITVIEHDENGKQFKISDHQGHFGGSCDGIVYLPPELFEPSGPVLAEYKTHGMTSFAKLLKIGMKKSKPEHWSQICTYGYKMGIKFFLYVAVNKNDDNLYIDFGEIDWDHGKLMVDKALTVIASQSPPKRAFKKGDSGCHFCNYKLLCHYKGKPDKNCRSCVYAAPHLDEKWVCNKYNQFIPKDFISVGCESWEPIDVHA